MLGARGVVAALRELVVLVAVAMAQRLRQLHLGLQTLVAVVVVGMEQAKMAHKAARVSSSSPTLAHSNSVAATSHPLVATPSTRSQHREPCQYWFL
jgi:hypothetical protein